MPKQERPKDYDAEPVVYCPRCYSLRIRHDDSVDVDWCMDCGGTETATASIDDWERLYEERYGHRFVTRHSGPKDSKYFKMSLNKLKICLYDSDMMKRIIDRLYPNFPKGLDKAETVIMLFDKLYKDNRIDDLRYMLYNYDESRNIKDNVKK